MFVWKKEFELGIKSIDEQHKHLLDIGNRINEMLVIYTDDDDENYDDILELIDGLKEYTVYHFKTEEDLFEKYNYPEYEKHKKEHDGFIDYFDAVDYDSIEDNEEVFLRELLNKLVSWVFNHIITTDYMYKDFLIALGTK